MIFSLRNGEGREESLFCCWQSLPLPGPPLRAQPVQSLPFSPGSGHIVYPCFWLSSGLKILPRGLCLDHRDWWSTFTQLTAICIKCPNNAGHCAFSAKKERKKGTNKRPHNVGKMDVNISAWLIISDVTLGKPQLSEWFICQGLEVFTPIMGSEGRLRAGSKVRTVLYVFWRFYLSFISKAKFSFWTKKEQKGTKNQWAVLFGLLFFTWPFPFFSAKLWNWMFGPQGWSRGWGFFLTCPGISRV